MKKVRCNMKLALNTISDFLTQNKYRVIRLTNKSSDLVLFISSENIVYSVSVEYYKEKNTLIFDAGSLFETFDNDANSTKIENLCYAGFLFPYSEQMNLIDLINDFKETLNVLIDEAMKMKNAKEKHKIVLKDVDKEITAFLKDKYTLVGIF